MLGKILNQKENISVQIFALEKSHELLKLCRFNQMEVMQSQQAAKQYSIRSVLTTLQRISLKLDYY